jgi:hypothetical protein
MITYLKDTDTLQAYNGSTWVAVGSPTLTANRAVETNGSGALAASSVTATELGYLSGVTSAIQTQLDAKTPGMVKVGATSFTAASSVPINNVFSATYKNYKVYIELTSSVNSGGGFRFRVSGADNSTANYSQQVMNVFGTSTAVSRTTGATSFSSVMDNNPSGSSAELTIFNPFATSKTYLHSHAMYDATNSELLLRSSAFNATTSFDGFTLLPASGTITGTLKVYGLVD